VKTGKEVTSQETTLVPLDRFNPLLQKIPIITLRKRTIQPGDPVEDTAFKPGLEIVEQIETKCRTN
jgi:hypothetical protein